MTYKERQELNEMSKKVFGTTSKWQKLVNNGIAETFERDREVMLPRANGRLAKKTFTDTKKVMRRYSVEEVRKLMEEELEKRATKKAASESTKALETATTE